MLEIGSLDATGATGRDLLMINFLKNHCTFIGGLLNVKIPVQPSQNLVKVMYNTDVIIVQPWPEGSSSSGWV